MDSILLSEARRIMIDGFEEDVEDGRVTFELQSSHAIDLEDGADSDRSYYFLICRVVLGDVQAPAAKDDITRDRGRHADRPWRHLLPTKSTLIRTIPVTKSRDNGASRVIIPTPVTPAAPALDAAESLEEENRHTKNTASASIPSLEAAGVEDMIWQVQLSDSTLAYPEYLVECKF